ncbi:hypothetical protein ACJJTC_007664 [Scirpophaga incertulas]
MINTNTVIEGILDFKNLPVEIEGINLVNDILDDMNELTPSKTSKDKSNYIERQLSQSVINENIEPQTNSTPLASKKAIPLPWYTTGDTAINYEHHENNLKPKTKSFFQDTAHRNDVQRDNELSKDVDVSSERNLYNNLMNSNEPEPECSQTIDSEIDKLLRLPERKRTLKRKQPKSPVPLAITSKKFKEYMERKSLEKSKKEKDILDRKILREQIKNEKQKKDNEKKKKQRKRVTKAGFTL